MTKLTYIKTDRNGTKYYADYTCHRCGGQGGSDSWAYTGWTCYECGGKGSLVTPRIIKEYTPEHRAKLDAEIAKRQAKRQAELEAKEVELRAEEERAEAERQAKEAEDKAKRELSQYVGNIGDKLEIAVTVAYVATYEAPSFRGWGTDTIHVYGMEDENGNAIIWKTTGSLKKSSKSETVSAHKGDKVTISGTIKEHNEYKGQRQTILNRVKLVSIEQLAEA